MNTTTNALLAVLLVALCGCGGDTYEITEQPLQGKVGGADWSFVFGETNFFLSDENDYVVALHGSAGAACGVSGLTGNKLLLSFPTSPGDYDLSYQRSMTFVVYEEDGIDNLAATDGRIIIDEITATTITGGVYGTFDGDNVIDGNFTATICTE